MEYVRKCVNRIIEFCHIVIISHERKFEMLSTGKRKVALPRLGQEFNQKNLTPSVKHADESLITRGCKIRKYVR